MDSAERFGHSGLDALCTLHAITRRGFRLRIVERLRGNHVGQRRRRAPLVDRGLCPLGLQISQDGCDLRHLSFIEVQLVGEKPQGSSNAEASTAELVAAAPSVERRAVPSASVPGTTTTRTTVRTFAFAT